MQPAGARIVGAAAARGAVLAALAEQVRGIERPVNTPLLAWDDEGSGPGIPLGTVQEWFGPDTSQGWTPPVLILMHLARRAARDGGHVAWIGRRTWPYLHPLGARGGTLLERSILLDPPTPAARDSAAELALRCPAVAAVVTDGTRMGMAASRRLQLAAAGGKAVALLARPAGELGELSAASGRWTVRHAPGQGPRWTIELLRCKGVRPLSEVPRLFTVEWDHAQGALAAVPYLEHRSMHEKAGPAPLPGRLTG